MHHAWRPHARARARAAAAAAAAEAAIAVVSLLAGLDWQRDQLGSGLGLGLERLAALTAYLVRGISGLRGFRQPSGRLGPL